MKPRTHSAALYVYAIGKQEPLREIFEAGGFPIAIEPETTQALVTDRDLAAVVSEVPLRVYGEGRFEEHMKDPSWTAERVMRHEALAEFIASRTPIVPLRFGVLYSSTEKIREMLTSKRSELNRALGRLQDHAEWGLNVYIDWKKLDEQIVTLSPKLLEMQQRVSKAKPGEAYLLEKKLESLRSAESKSEAKSVVDNVLAAVRPLAADFKHLPVREHEAKRDPAIAAKFALLIERSQLGPLRRAAEKLAHDRSKSGFALELTGPWPPYNFCQ